METDMEILNHLAKTRNHSQRTKADYKSTTHIYTQFNQLSLIDLIKEAEYEEEQGIRWKDRKIKKRLSKFREYCYDNYMCASAKSHMQRIQTIYRFFEIELQPLMYMSTKQIKLPVPLIYGDLPDKEVIREALNISTPLMSAIILFMSSSGTARAETLSITIGDFIESVNEYVYVADINEVILELKQRNDIIPMFKLKRKKINEYYYTFCSPEATDAIIEYLLTREDKVKLESQLFKIHPVSLTKLFININNKLGLGKKGTYNRFRSHMLRKYHSTTLDDCDNKLTIQDIDFLQGRSDSKTRRSYFMKNEKRLKMRYAESMNDITINKKYKVSTDYETLSLHVTESMGEEIKPVKAQNIDLKKENQKLIEENTNLKNNLKKELRKIFEDILEEKGLHL